MKVVAFWKDGSFYDVEVSKEFEKYGPAFAIEKGKEILRNLPIGEYLDTVDHYEIEEDFL